jgi:hypothetical protein
MTMKQNAGATDTKRPAKSRTLRGTARATRGGASRSARPETQSPLREEIEKAAYFKAERRGFAPGHEIEDWLEAERELRVTQEIKAKGRATLRGAGAPGTAPQPVLES